MLKIRYLSHGLEETGGYRHEMALAKTLADALTHCDDCFEVVRFKRNYRGFLAWFRLFLQAFSAAKGDVIITVSRLSWPVYLRHLFSRTKIILVMHNWDTRDGKPPLYYTSLGAFLRLAAKRKNKIAVVVVAKYWHEFVQQKFGIDNNLFVFPNVFDNSKLQFYRDIARRNTSMVHLGQWSEKADKKMYRLLIHLLEKEGMVCYFSDNTRASVTDFPIMQFDSPEAYLKQMSESKCTVILNRIDEGWNRVAHESFMVGTQVIATNSGGLGELVGLAGGHLVSNAEEAWNKIQSGNLGSIHEEALEKFDFSHALVWAEPMVNWIYKNNG